MGTMENTKSVFQIVADQIKEQDEIMSKRTLEYYKKYPRTIIKKKVKNG